VLLTDKQAEYFGIYRHRRDAQISRRLRPTRVPLVPDETPNRKQWGALSSLGGRGAQCPGSRQTGEGRLFSFFFLRVKKATQCKKERERRAQAAQPPLSFRER